MKYCFYVTSLIKLIQNRYARFLNYTLLNNGKKEDKMRAKSYFQRSCELGFKKAAS